MRPLRYAAPWPSASAREAERALRAGSCVRGRSIPRRRRCPRGADGSGETGVSLLPLRVGRFVALSMTRIVAAGRAPSCGRRARSASRAGALGHVAEGSPPCRPQFDLRWHRAPVPLTLSREKGLRTEGLPPKIEGVFQDSLLGKEVPMRQTSRYPMSMTSLDGGILLHAYPQPGDPGARRRREDESY
jgi:hypothetical protein